MADKPSIGKALRDNRRFLAYVKINALLHDADKVTADFLEWSMRKNVKSLDPGVSKYSGCYTKHNEEDRSIILECLKDILPYQDAFNPVPLPCKKIVNSPYKKQPAIFRDVGQGTTIYDFFRHHHKLNLVLDAYLPSSLLLFSPGTAGIDGIDTGFETEAFRRPDLKEHHTPDLLDDEQAAIATPFGFERKVDWHEAGKNFLTLHDDLRLIHQILDDIGRGKEALSLVNSFMEKLPFSFGRSIIRTGRPVNDVTLADHSISVAALTTAQAVRMVMETEAMPKNSYYCMPIRRIGNSIPHWPQTGFAIFSCGVNTGSLDSMAVDLKDISAIRDQVQKYFDAFQELFTETLPVGGTVYRDQHGIHLVVPVLGDPDYRWKLKDSADDEWCSPDPAALSNDAFVKWLLDIGREKLLQLEDIHFGRELLTGLRVADIGQELNRLAEAIEWSRTFSTLHVKAEDATNGATRYFSRESSVSGKEKPGQLCKVCNLRVSTNRGKHGRQKCDICTERILTRPPLTRKETNDLKEMAGGSEDNRLALLTVSFNLHNRLSEKYNSGIFCFPKAAPGKSQDFIKNRSPRLNSFGRFRRIWRTSEDFLVRQREYIYQYCQPTDSSPVSRMRTILLEPQDMQIILPAEKTGHVLDKLLENFELEFGRVAGRIPLHVSLLVFPFSTPIYLVLEGATRLRRANLTITPKVAECCMRAGKLRRIVRGRRKFEFRVQVQTQQDQPENAGMDGRDRFHANLEVAAAAGSQWCFAEEFEADEIKKVLMIPNMLSIAEIGGGFVLNELEQSAKDLSPTRCHSIPLEYWHQLKQLLRIEKNISASQRRAMRGVLAARERHWPEDVDSKTQELAIEMLWRDPARVGSRRWKDPGTDRKLLCDCCRNGMIFLAGMVKKRLGELS